MNSRARNVECDEVRAGMRVCIKDGLPQRTGAAVIRIGHHKGGSVDGLIVNNSHGRGGRTRHLRARVGITEDDLECFDSLSQLVVNHGDGECFAAIASGELDRTVCRYVVRASLRRAIDGSESHRTSRGERAQAVDLNCCRPAIFVDVIRHGMERKGGGLIVEDFNLSGLCSAQNRPACGIAQRQVQSLGGFGNGIVCDRNGEALNGFAIVKGQRA